MVLATVATDLHQFGQALAADLIGWGAAVIGDRADGLRGDLGAPAHAGLSPHAPGQP